MKYFSTSVLLVLAVLVPLTLAYAGNGKIAGVVKDATGKPIPGANVVVQATVRGASADAEGRYFILDVSPGSYSVTVSAVGFEKLVYTGIKVSADVTTELNAVLKEAPVTAPEIVVQAERPLVDKTQTSTKTTLSTQEISNLPVATIFDVMNTAASTYNGFIRGSRYVETRTIVDGVDITDNYSAIDAEARGIEAVQNTYSGVVRPQDRNNVNANVTLSSVAEASVNTGAVGAEYSSSTAGIMNLNLKEGRGPLGGYVFLRSSAGGLHHLGPLIYNDKATYFAERDASVDAARKSAYTWYSDKYDYDEAKGGLNKPTMDAEIALGGGLTNDLGMYFTGRLYNSYGRFPSEFNRQIDLSLKGTYQFTSDIKLTGLGIVRDRGKLFGWKNRVYNDVYRYFLEGVPVNNGLSTVASLKWTHFLSPKTFYELQLSNVNNDNYMGYVNGNGDGIIQMDEKGDFITFASKDDLDKYLDKFFSSGPKNGPSLTNFGDGPYQLKGAGIYYENTTNNILTLRGDITSQITFNHQLKGGVQVRQHSISKLLRSSPVGIVEENFKVYPREYGIYLQDRMEYAGMIINVGFRVDGLDLNEGEYNNFFYPAVKDAYPPYGTARAVSLRAPEKLTTKWYFTPRIGVSHPISDVAALYFSFSRQMTPQPFANVFAAYNIYGTSPILPGVPRLDQDPFKSTNYELGAQWSFIRDMSLDVNAYFRSIENYGLDAVTVVWRSPAGIPNLYTLQFSGGYANSRGVELTLNKRPTTYWNFLTVSGRLSYAYSYIKATSGPLGTTIDAKDITQFSTTGGDSLRYGGTIPFSDFAYYNRIMYDVTGAMSTLTGGYDRAHRINFSLFFQFPMEVSLNLLGKFASGFYYSLAYGDPRSRELGQAPWTKQIDLRLEKAFTFGRYRVAAFLDVKNLLESENILTYYASPSGRGQYLWEVQGDPTGPDKKSLTPDGSPIYDIAREIYIGVTFNF